MAADNHDPTTGGTDAVPDPAEGHEPEAMAVPLFDQDDPGAIEALLGPDEQESRAEGETPNAEEAPLNVDELLDEPADSGDGGGDPPEPPVNADNLVDETYGDDANELRREFRDGLDRVGAQATETIGHVQEVILDAIRGMSSQVEGVDQKADEAIRLATRANDNAIQSLEEVRGLANGESLAKVLADNNDIIIGAATMAADRAVERLTSLVEANATQLGELTTEVRNIGTTVVGLGDRVGAVEVAVRPENLRATITTVVEEVNGGGQFNWLAAAGALVLGLILTAAFYKNGHVNLPDANFSTRLDNFYHTTHFWVGVILSVALAVAAGTFISTPHGNEENPGRPRRQRVTTVIRNARPSNRAAEANTPDEPPTLVVPETPPVVEPELQPAPATP